MDEYYTIFKNKLYQVRTTIAFSHASVVKVGGLSAQVEIQALQSDLMFKVILLLGILASTLYFVHWYLVRFDNSCKTLALDYLGSNLFKSSSIVCACCNLHIPEESVVLLENGILFLFDLVSYSLNGYVIKSELRVLWDDLSGTENYKWLGIKLSLHPRILVVA
ncbi:WD repeat and FYVE domain-containing protein 3 [Gossypium australe]|uniref:WD repeat and FYVE domain-containing protein 3 n=1 Tax=Gossypium australe TaxID=47621 RepID=A0A5B6WQ86_9ROSI|nr:WD repeat and FYVE domain-containing protein 3 [Gossypium australe]